MCILNIFNEFFMNHLTLLFEAHYNWQCHNYANDAKSQSAKSVSQICYWAEDLADWLIWDDKHLMKDVWWVNHSCWKLLERGLTLHQDWTSECLLSGWVHNLCECKSRSAYFWYAEVNKQCTDIQQQSVLEHVKKKYARIWDLMTPSIVVLYSIWVQTWLTDSC